MAAKTAHLDDEGWCAGHEVEACGLDVGGQGLDGWRTDVPTVQDRGVLRAGFCGVVAVSAGGFCEGYHVLECGLVLRGCIVLVSMFDVELNSPKLKGMNELQ